MLPFCFLVFVQVVLEGLPVSSSGHVWLACKGLVRAGAMLFCEQVGLLDAVWNNMLHIPTLFIVTVFFTQRYWHCMRRPLTMVRILLPLAVWIVCADVCTAILFPLMKSIPAYRVLVGGGFAFTGCCLLALNVLPSQNKRFSRTALCAVVMGVIQACALLPGISRLAITYSVARVMGLRPQRAFELSWLLHIPLIVAAVGRDTLYMVSGSLVLPCISLSSIVLIGATLAGFVSFMVGALFLERGITRPFGYYLLMVAALAFFI